jgi:hypothetical protein
VRSARIVMLFVAGIAMITGCGTVKANDNNAIRTQASVARGSAIEISRTKAWANEGLRLLRVKAGWRASGRTVANASPFAYESLPVDISANGRYTLEFGPLGKIFDFPSNPKAVVFDFPSDIHFVVLPNGKASTVAVDGKRYFKVGISVTKLTRSYQEMTAWIY